MNLDELVNSVPETELRKNLFLRVGEWKQDDKDIEALASLISKWHGHVWFKDRGGQTNSILTFRDTKMLP